MSFFLQLINCHFGHNSLIVSTIWQWIDQSHYIEVAQGDIFMEQKNVIWAGFGPIDNTEKCHPLGACKHYVADDHT